MSTNFFEVRKGINLDNTQTSAVSVKGDIAYNTSTDKLELFDGAVDPIVAETKAATLTNKSISGSSNTLTNVPASALSGTVSLTSQVSGTLPVLNGGTGTTTSTGTTNVVLSNSPTFTGTITFPGTSSIDGSGNAIFAGNLTTNNGQITLGNKVGAGNGASIQFIPSSTHTNWLIGSNFNVTGGIEFTPSTIGGGSTFTTPALTLNSSGQAIFANTTSTSILNASGLVTASGGLTVPVGQLGKFNGSASGAALSVSNATGVGTTLFQAQIAGVSSGMQIVSDNSNNLDYKFNSGISNTTEFEIADTTSTITAGYKINPTAGLVGTIAGGNAASGIIGEYITGNPASSVSPVTSGTQFNVMSISLTAGDWDVEGVANLFIGSSSVVTGFRAMISLTSGIADLLNAGGITGDNRSFVSTQVYYFPLSVRRISISTTTTVYLVAFLNYSVLGGAVFDTASTIIARRVR